MVTIVLGALLGVSVALNVYLVYRWQTYRSRDPHHHTGAHSATGFVRRMDDETLRELDAKHSKHTRHADAGPRTVEHKRPDTPRFDRPPPATRARPVGDDRSW